MIDVINNICSWISSQKSTNWISLLGIVVTAFFSFVLWRVSKNSAKAAEAGAEATKTMYELSKMIYENQQIHEKEFFEAYKKEYRSKIKQKARLIKDAVLGKYSVDTPFNQAIIDWESIKKIPLTHELSEHDLIKYFNQHERDKITTSWQFLNEFLNYYGEDTTRQGIGKAGSIIASFTELENIFDK